MAENTEKAVEKKTTNSRIIDPKALQNLARSSEVVEKGNNNVSTEEEQEEMLVVRKKTKKITKAISISLPLGSYNEYIAYLNKNDVDSGSELIRGLLKEAGIIS